MLLYSLEALEVNFNSKKLKASGMVYSGWPRLVHITLVDQPVNSLTVCQPSVQLQTLHLEGRL